MTRFCFLCYSYGFLDVGRPLREENVSIIYSNNCFWAVTPRSKSRRTHHLRLPQPGGPGPHIYIPQEHGGPVIPPGTGSPFHCLLRLAGQPSLLAIQHWLTKWQLKANRSKSTHVTFTTRRAKCPGVHIYNEQLPQA
jgi:hypothetical protein